MFKKVRIIQLRIIPLAISHVFVDAICRARIGFNVMLELLLLDLRTRGFALHDSELRCLFNEIVVNGRASRVETGRVSRWVRLTISLGNSW
jgi:hypothetical protein